MLFLFGSGSCRGVAGLQVLGHQLVHVQEDQHLLVDGGDATDEILVARSPSARAAA
jgi:hypothetical protein